MLKIKDEVDLKELEKFGFKYTEGEDWHKSNFDMYLSLGDKRELNIDCDDHYFNTDIRECVDWIFDLIRAGLVEKVEG